MLVLHYQCQHSVFEGLFRQKRHVFYLIVQEYATSLVVLLDWLGNICRCREKVLRHVKRFRVVYVFPWIRIQDQYPHFFEVPVPHKHNYSLTDIKIFEVAVNKSHKLPLVKKY